jgi:hypothetical protein
MSRASGTQVDKKKISTAEEIDLALQSIGAAPGVIPKIVTLLTTGELQDNERLMAWLKLLEFIKPKLKAVDHSGTVSQVQVQLSHSDIKEILARDPFTAAKPVPSETKE